MHRLLGVLCDLGVGRQRLLHDAADVGDGQEAVLLPALARWGGGCEESARRLCGPGGSGGGRSGAAGSRRARWRRHAGSGASASATAWRRVTAPVAHRGPAPSRSSPELSALMAPGGTGVLIRRKRRSYSAGREGRAAHCTSSPAASVLRSKVHQFAVCKALRIQSTLLGSRCACQTAERRPASARSAACGPAPAATAFSATRQCCRSLTSGVQSCGSSDTAFGLHRSRPTLLRLADCAPHLYQALQDAGETLHAPQHPAATCGRAHATAAAAAALCRCLSPGPADGPLACAAAALPSLIHGGS